MWDNAWKVTVAMAVKKLWSSEGENTHLSYFLSTFSGWHSSAFQRLYTLKTTRLALSHRWWESPPLLWFPFFPLKTYSIPSPHNLPSCFQGHRIPTLSKHMHSAFPPGSCRMMFHQWAPSSFPDAVTPPSLLPLTSGHAQMPGGFSQLMTSYLMRCSARSWNGLQRQFQ